MKAMTKSTKDQLAEADKKLLWSKRRVTERLETIEEDILCVIQFDMLTICNRCKQGKSVSNDDSHRLQRYAAIASNLKARLDGPQPIVQVMLNAPGEGGPRPLSAIDTGALKQLLREASEGTTLASEPLKAQDG